MIRWASYIACALFSLSLFANEDLDYGLATENGDLVRSALIHLSQKEYDALFANDTSEKIAYTYIQEACHSPVVVLRLEGLFGAKNAHNAQGALLLEKALDDPHALIRSYARQASSGYFDSFIQQKLRQQITSKQGQERIEAFSYYLEKDPEQALLLAKELFDNKETPVSDKLAIGERLSQAACYKDQKQVLATLEKLSNQEILLWLATGCPSLAKEDLLIQNLTNGSLSSIIASLEYVGLWGYSRPEIRQSIQELLHSNNVFIQSKAAWVALVQIPELKSHAHEAIRSLAMRGDQAASLASISLCRSGQSGVILALDLYKNMDVHPIVRLNAALHLLRYRAALEEAPYELLETLQSIRRPLRQNEAPGQAMVYASSDDESIYQQIAQYKDASVRCSLLGLALNTSDSPSVFQLSYQMAEEILKKKAWGPLLESGSLFFFQVGPKSINLARRLSGSLHEEVRIQAAGILAAMNCQKEALQVLEQEVFTSSFDGKMATLAILPLFSLKDALPFLKNAMKENSSLLRIRGAGVFLFMKYHTK